MTRKQQENALLSLQPYSKKVRHVYHRVKRYVVSRKGSRKVIISITQQKGLSKLSQSRKVCNDQKAAKKVHYYHYYQTAKRYVISITEQRGTL